MHLEMADGFWNLDIHCVNSTVGMFCFTIVGVQHTNSTSGPKCQFKSLSTNCVCSISHEMAIGTWYTTTILLSVYIVIHFTEALSSIEMA